MRTRIFALTASAFTFTLIACGGSESAGPVSSVSQSTTGVDGGGPLFTRTGGTFSAVPIDAIGGAAYLLPAPGGTSGVQSRLLIVIGDHPNLCADGPVHSGGTVFSVDALSGDAKFHAGTFTEMQREAPGQVDVSVSKLNASCGSDGKDFGSATGSVTLTAVTDTGVAGTFDVALLGDAGTLQGTFNVPLCNLPFSSTCQK